MAGVRRVTSGMRFCVYWGGPGIIGILRPGR